MGAKGYTPAQRLEAVALARVIGSDAAGAQLGIQPRTITGWMRKAGDPPEIEGSSDQWRRLLDLAHARTEAALASGKLTPIQVATIAGIAQRNVSKPVVPSVESAVTARQAFDDWFVDTIAETLDESTTEETCQATRDGMEEIEPELLRRANDEPGQPHRGAMLAWFSGRSEVEAGDVLEWAQGQVRAILAEHGNVIAFAAWCEAQREAERATRIAQERRNKVGALLWRARSELRRTEA